MPFCISSFIKKNYYDDIVQLTFSFNEGTMRNVGVFDSTFGDVAEEELLVKKKSKNNFVLLSNVSLNKSLTMIISAPTGKNINSQYILLNLMTK